MSASVKLHRRVTASCAVFACAAFLAACTSNEPSDSGDGGVAANNEPNDEVGETVTIGYSGPAASHGWLGSMSTIAQEVGEEYEDIDLQMAEGTDDVNQQISQVETFINDDVDAIVVLPSDGPPLTDVAMEAMEAGIPVVNVDREFSDSNAARTTVLGDNYGMGISAGEYICEQLADETDPVIGEIAGIDNLELTQDRSQGFADALEDCDMEVSNRVDGDFTPQGGESATSNLLQAAPEIDAIWNHDDDQGVGVLAAINNSDRDEFFLVGGAGSANMMREIEDEDSVVDATVLYPANQAADGVKLARLLAQDKAMGDLVDLEVPRLVQLDAPVVTADNVDQYIDSAFES